MTTEHDAAKVREAVERVRDIASAGYVPTAWDDFQLVCDAALDSLAQCERAGELDRLAFERARQIDQLRSELEAARAERERLREDVEHWKERTRVFRAEATNREQQRDQLQRELEAARAERERLNAKVEEAREERNLHHRISVKAETQRDHWRKLAGEYQEQIAELKSATPSRDKAAAEAELLSVALAELKEQCTSTDAEWQQHLMPLHEGYTGDGCESGDPRDWTYSALRQRMNAYENELDELRAAATPSRDVAQAEPDERGRRPS